MATARRLVVLAALVLAVALAGCAGLAGTDDEVDADDFDADEIQTDAIDATRNATTYAFGFDQCLTSRSEQGALRFGIESSGQADGPEHLTEIDVAVTLGTTCGQNLSSVAGDAYHVGETVHKREGDAWQTSTAGEYWEPTDQDVTLLEGANVTITGLETVDGNETVVLDVDPASDDSVAAYGLHQAVVQDLLQSGVEIQSANVTQYVAVEEPHRVLRTEIELTADDAEGGGEFDANLTTTYDYDADVAIELPDAIRD